MLPSPRVGGALSGALVRNIAAAALVSNARQSRARDWRTSPRKAQTLPTRTILTDHQRWSVGRRVVVIPLLTGALEQTRCLGFEMVAPSASRSKLIAPVGTTQLNSGVRQHPSYATETKPKGT
jgi:hypothetical protein